MFSLRLSSMVMVCTSICVVKLALLFSGRLWTSGGHLALFYALNVGSYHLLSLNVFHAMFVLASCDIGFRLN